MTDTYKGELKNVICYKMPKKLKSHLLLNDYKTNYLKWGKLNKIITSMYYIKNIHPPQTIYVSISKIPAHHRWGKTFIRHLLVLIFNNNSPHPRLC
jgi:hypothetical protein